MIVRDKSGCEWFVVLTVDLWIMRVERFRMSEG